MTSFIDQVTLHVQGGNGGHGCASVHREKFKPLGGPDGGNGGNGGDVVLVVDPSVTTLLDFHRSPHRSAGNGKPGQGDHRNGAYGEHLELSVPEGTVVSLSDGTVLSSRTTSRVTPFSPRSAKPGALRFVEASAALPSPPRPPAAIT